MKQKITLLALSAILGLAACQETNKQENTTGDADTAVLKDHDNDKSTVTSNDLGQANSANDAAPAAWSWEGLDWKSPIVKYDEVKSDEVAVRGNDQYGIYELDERVLFDKDQATLRNTAQAHLDKVLASINQHYPNAHIGIFGFTDSTGSQPYNKQLSEQRAQAVKQYLASHGHLDADRISVSGYGENKPVASNATTAGRQENRRVQIVAKK